LVLGTHAALVRELVRELASRAPESSSDASESLVLDARGVQRVLEQNLDVLVAQKMLEKGLDRDAAARELAWLQRILAALREAHLELRSDARGDPVLDVHVSWADAER